MNLISKYKDLFKKVPDSRYFLITGGRGSGKSFHVALFLLNLTYEKNEVILFTRWTMVSAHISIIPEFIEKIDLMNLNEDFEIKQTEIINKKTGSIILFKGIKTSQGTATANLKSIAGVTCFVLDEAEELVDEDVFDKIDLSIRAKNKHNRVIMIMNPSNKQHWIYKNWISQKRANTSYIHTTYLDNLKNLNPSFLERAESVKNTNLDRYNHLFLGEWTEDSEGVLWNREMIERLRITTKPEFKRVVIAIDPAITSTKDSDETGIVACAKDEHGKGYVLEDLSGRYTPNEWAKVAHEAMKRHDADCYVAEKNQGGDMVKAVLMQEDKRNRIKLVTATKSKYTRAEPIYALYEQSKIYHIGNFPILEREMTTFNPNENKLSPNRVDSLVWGFTELFEKNDVPLFLY